VRFTPELQRIWKNATKPILPVRVVEPLKLVYSESFPTFSEARKREAQIKRWTRAKKEALVAGNMSELPNLSKSRNKKRF
jgi:predicted GIY-YIG superfamily endonuclease